jgi:DNA-nicking Smr family endonuclease
MSADERSDRDDETGRRSLTAEEEHLWSIVARSIKPLRRAACATPSKRAAKTEAAKPAGGSSKKSVAPLPSVSRPRAAAPAQIPLARRERQRIARGRSAIEGRIDLHGMTQADAYSALLHFLHRSQAGGAKVVLVITGKGSPFAGAEERGVLRRQVPLWLALPQFRACVLGFDMADATHGGAGALYVRLRRASR